jgi:hypothetical protein
LLHARSICARVDGRQTLATKPVDQPIDLAAWSDSFTSLEIPVLIPTSFSSGAEAF